MLVPIEHLGPQGMQAAFADLVRERAGWTAERVRLFDRGFALYWARGEALAARTRSWVAPRLRHVAVVEDPLSVRPYAQLLNTSAWTVYGADLDPHASDPELFAYLLVLGDRMATSGQVAPAAVQTALWWLERTDEECDAFAEAARRSCRPDAGALCAVADALGWLRRLHHDPLRRPPVIAPYRSIPGTGLLVSPALAAEPPALIATWERVAAGVLDDYRARHRAVRPAAAADLCAWLRETTPALLVTRGEHVVWDSVRPDETRALGRALEGSPAAAVTDIACDLQAIERVTRTFFAAVVDADALPAAVPANTTQTGYSYLHRERRLIAYNLDEAGIERLQGPALPYARFMLAARTAHEWAHLADAGGWVPRIAGDEAWQTDRAALAELLEAVIAAASAAARRETAADLAELGRGRPLGPALVRVLVSRLPDYRANLVARHLLTSVERETYVRQNVRILRQEYAPATRWRLLIRYLFEYQYLEPALGMTAVPDPYTFFMGSTGFARDFFATGMLDAERFRRLAAAVSRLCTGYAVDRAKLRFA